MLGVVLDPVGAVVLGAVVVVEPEVIPPMLDVGEVFPIGGVVPVVVFGVVPEVVFGVVPVVVFGVVPGVVLGAVLVEGVGIVAGGLGGHIVLLLDGVLADGLGILALGLVADALDVLMPGELDAVGVVVVTGQAVAGVDCIAGDAGVVLCPALALEDCEPGTTGVGAIAPVVGEVDWAVAMPTAQQRKAANRVSRAFIHFSCWFLMGWHGGKRWMLSQM